MNRWSILQSVRKRYVVKLTFTYSIIFAVSLFITIDSIGNTLLAVVRNTEISNQHHALERTGEFTVRLYDRINGIILKQFYLRELSGTVAQYFASSDPLPPEIEHDVREFLTVVSFGESHILDILLVGSSGGKYFYGSPVRARSEDPMYEFSKVAVALRIKASEHGLAVVPDIPEYLLNTREPVISFAGPLLDSRIFPRRNEIGFFVINVTPEVFLEAYRTYASEIMGEFFVLNNEDEVLFGSNMSQRGKRYQSLDDLLAESVDEAGSSRGFIVNQYYHADSGIRLVIATSEEKIEQKWGEIRMRILPIVAVSFLVTIFLTILISRAFGARITTLSESMRQVQNGDLTVRVSEKGDDEIGMLERTFNGMCSQLDEYIGRVYISELQRKNAEFAAFQARINPHFLYNTLELVRAKAAANGDDEAAEMLSSLGRLFRWNIKGGSALVRLEDELDSVLEYINLQKACMSEPLEIEIDVDDELYGVKVPRLILQPIIENAFQHGLIPKRSAGGLYIRGKRCDSSIIIVIEDNGVGMDNDRLSMLRTEIEGEEPRFDTYHLGLRNTGRRIKLMYGSEWGLKIESAEGSGTRVQIALPFESTVSEIDEGNRG